MSSTTLSQPTICECGEEMEVTSHEVLNFDSIQCPSCGSDVYHEEWLYEEALYIEETDFSELDPAYHGGR